MVLNIAENQGDEELEGESGTDERKAANTETKATDQVKRNGKPLQRLSPRSSPETGDAKVVLLFLSSEAASPPCSFFKSPHLEYQKKKLISALTYPGDGRKQQKNIATVLNTCFST